MERLQNMTMNIKQWRATFLKVSNLYGFIMKSSFHELNNKKTSKRRHLDNNMYSLLECTEN